MQKRKFTLFGSVRKRVQIKSDKENEGTEAVRGVQKTASGFMRKEILNFWDWKLGEYIILNYRKCKASRSGFDDR